VAHGPARSWVPTPDDQRDGREGGDGRGEGEQPGEGGATSHVGEPTVRLLGRPTRSRLKAGAAIAPMGGWQTPSMARRVRSTAVVALLAALGASWAPMADAFAQDGPTTSVLGAGSLDRPALVAPVEPDPAVAPAVRLGDVWVDAAASGPDAPTFVVDVPGIAELGGRIPSPWRVSVSVGDPAGTRVRSSLVVVAGAGTTGRAEIGDGVVWTDDGEVDASLDGTQARIAVPIGSVAPGAAVWVEAEAAADGSIDVAATPAFRLDDLLGRDADVAVAASGWASAPGREAEGGFVAVGGGGPALLVSAGSVDVATTEVVPAQVAGLPVTELVDRLRLGRPDTSLQGGRRSDEVVIDRLAGTVSLVPVDGEPVPAELGTTPWLSGVTGGGDLRAAGAVSIDLAALDLALDGPPLDRATTAVSVSRSFVLADGTVVVAPSVQADIAWFDEALAPAPAPAAAAGEGDEGGWLVPVAVTAGVVALLAALAVLAARAWRSPRPSTPTVTISRAVPIDLDERRRAREGDDGHATDPRSSARPARADLPAGGVWPAPATSDPSTGARRAPHATSPVDALTALFADVDQLTAEVDRILGDDGDDGATADPGRQDPG
jgi:hypothetical protein